MKNFAIYDDVLSKDEQDKVEKYLTDYNFPWYLQKATVSKPIKDSMYKREIPFMGHAFCLNSVPCSLEYEMTFSVLNTICKKINLPYKRVLRSRANLVFKDGSVGGTGIHVDFEEEHTVVLYYVNESDGDTTLYADDLGKEVLQTISPKKGRVIIFDGLIKHSAGVPVNHPTRIVLNYNLLNTRDPILERLQNL